MGLVDYSESDGEDEVIEPQTKKRKLSSEHNKALPPLPAGFRDLYSSTVRTSVQDDPALHGGRKRVTPHVAGNWPTHIYLDWTPSSTEDKTLRETVSYVHKTAGAEGSVHSLLENDLGVQQPLHVSLSRPLALKTEDKDDFLQELESAITGSSVRTFTVRPLDLVWHANEDRTRWFLVLRLQQPSADELQTLLKKCNALAAQFNQPLLYHGGSSIAGDDSEDLHDSGPHDSFHISVAWSLKFEDSKQAQSGPVNVDVSPALLEQLEGLKIKFSEVKVRVGQDVHSTPLQQARERR
ncbi:Putative U6 snRNA phosphodiesterase Usb1 [Septoria linicola]|uniref:U6 snRNA phosphodiesterase n=1 Tax=Septoria linicola TaxID=215465 RepID=A0A9Q9AYB6_9PEZI|nr:Putative U6 snRNA phosphodiesterase Usb1 [Septoria linicola]